MPSIFKKSSFPNLPSLDSDMPSDERVVDANGRFTPARYSAYRGGLTASAVQINLKDKKELEILKDRRSKDGWQTQAWAYTELIGEVHFAANLMGNIMSRIRLYPAFITDEDMIPADIQNIDDKGISDELKADARRALRLLATGNGGISGLLKDASINLFVAGECYLFQRKSAAFQKEIWEIRSVDEIVFKTSGRNQGIYMKGRRDDKEENYVKTDSAFLGRIWNSYARYSDEADSSIRPLLELLDEILMWNKAVRSAIKSQMNGGILFLPDELSNADASDGEGEFSEETPDQDLDDIDEVLLRALIAPIDDENAYTSVAPVILRGPSDVGDKIRHFPLGKNLPEVMQARADKALDRVLSGLDLPKDIVGGLGSTKYASSMVIEESMYKSHIEPLALMIVDALTTVFFKPVLRAYGYSDDELERVVLWYDPSSIAAKPSKSDAADKGYDSRVISAQAWRREHGFSEADRPSQLEVGQRLAVDRGLLDEATSSELFKTLIPEVFEGIRERTLAESPDGEVLEEVFSPDALVPSPEDPESMAPIIEGPTSDQDEIEYDGAPTGLIEPNW